MVAIRRQDRDFLVGGKPMEGASILLGVGSYEERVTGSTGQVAGGDGMWGFYELSTWEIPSV